MFVLILVIFSLFWLFFFYNFYWKRRNLPPGPIPLPILGNIPQMSGKDRYQVYKEWANKYGPIYTIWINEQPFVILTNYELIKETVIKNGDNYVDRDFLYNHFFVMHGSVDGLIRSVGEQWKQMRTFLFKAMRNYGLEGETLRIKWEFKNKVIDAVFYVIGEIEQEIVGGLREHSIDHKVDLMTGSVINRMLLGYGFYGEHSNEFIFLKKLLDIQQEYFGSLAASMIEASPWLRNFPYFSTKFAECERTTEELFNYGRMEIEKRLEARRRADYEQTETEGGDLLDQFLDQIERSDQNDSDNYYKLQYLPAFIYDIFLAGQETTSNTINFMILYLMLDQSVQKKMHAELDRIMGEKRSEAGDNLDNFEPKFGQSDRTRLNYTNAVVHESQRLCNLLPMNLTRIVGRDVEIGGKKVPAGTTLVPQISTVLYDENIFPDPLEFRPERFLDESNGQFKKIEEFIPFGVGKRICPGEALGRLELFLFAANFFYKFHVYPPNPLEPPKNFKRPTFCREIARIQMPCENSKCLMKFGIFE